ncbi:hypothetical protein C7M84_023050 [Penaeus vannamei]|uniref:Gustatory receptor n=1 Tax=Penaeus vannamei TaxID=6689 RepID=A0A3R7Q1T1_PENVA|nr:hypothetical protein C7M84_023050 [Penaeus vannamei]
MTATRLFGFQAEETVSLSPSEIVAVTEGERALSDISAEGLSPCNHEADSSPSEDASVRDALPESAPPRPPSLLRHARFPNRRNMRFLGILLGVLRLVGGFPYVESGDGAAGADTRAATRNRVGTDMARRKESPLYEKNRFWVLWSCVIPVVFLTYPVYSIWAMFDGKRSLPRPASTLVTAIVVKEGVLLISITSVVGYLIYQRSLALELVSELQRFRRSTRASSPKRARNGFMAFLMACFVGGYSTIIGKEMIYIVQNFSWGYVLVDFFEFVFWFLIDAFTMCFYFTAVSAMSDAYDDLISTLAALRPPPRTASVSVATKQSALAVAAGPTAGSPAAEGLFESASESLVRLHDLHRLLHRYMAFPITVSMQVSVISTIISLFFMTFWSGSGSFSKVEAIAFLVVGALPFVVLSNIPEILKCRVEELRVLLWSLRRRRPDQGLRQAVSGEGKARWQLMLRFRARLSSTDLLETLSEFPGFQLCGLFTLGRPCVVDICSFMATYLIILLQFLASER